MTIPVLKIENSYSGSWNDLAKVVSLVHCVEDGQAWTQKSSSQVSQPLHLAAYFPHLPPPSLCRWQLFPLAFSMDILSQSSLGGKRICAKIARRWTLMRASELWFWVSHICSACKTTGTMGTGPTGSGTWCSLLDPTPPKSPRPFTPILNVDSSLSLFLADHPDQVTALIS